MAGPKAVVNAIVGNGENAIKSSACWIWRPTGNVIDHTSKDSGSYMFKRFDYVDLQGRLKRGKREGGNTKASCKIRLFSWVFFLATKDETPEILKNFITGIENQIDHKVKTIRRDNGTEFKNRIMNEFCEMKSIRRKFSIARTPHQNGVAERKNRTLIEAARTMLADSKLPTTFWAEAVNTACYVQNRVLFDGNSDDGFFVGYSINSKAFRVFNTRTRFVEENLHINFIENKPNVTGTGPNWMFNIDTLTMSMNYQPVFAGNQTNGNVGTKVNIDAGQAGKKTVSGSIIVLLPFLSSDSQGPKSSNDEVKWMMLESRMKLRIQQKKVKRRMLEIKKRLLENNLTKNLKDYLVKGRLLTLTTLTDLILVFGQDKDTNGNSTYKMFTPVNADGSSYENLGGSIPVNATTFPNDDFSTDPLMSDLKDTADLQVTGIFSGAYDDEDVGAEADLNNLETTMSSLDSGGFPKGKRAIGTKWVYRNKKDERGIIVRNKARLVAQGYNQEEGIDYDEVFAPVARIEAIRLIFVYCHHLRGFIVYQIDVKSAFLYGTIEDEVMQRDDGIFISQDKYVADILKKFDFSSVKTASTLIETHKALLKDEEAEDVDVYLYRSMIGSLMYLTTSRPDIMFAVCACARDSPFDLEAFSDSDYAGASLDRKSTTGGCQFLGKRLILWQCKKQTIVANSTIEAKYVAAANCCGQVLWIQNQMLDYGFNFMNTKIYIDNESTICIVKNPLFYSKTKHIKIRHHFIKDSYEKKLIQFVDQHNMVACLVRTEENADFHQINTANSQTVNDVKQIHAIVDAKIVVMSESSVRSDLHFNDEDGITCLTNTAIFENLALMGSKSTSWNEFSTNIASAVICLATGQKFNFSKLIFDEPFNDTYETPIHTKKVFTNMKRKGKDFLGRVTSLFASLLAPPVVGGEEQIPVTELSLPQKTQSPRQALQKDTQLPHTSVPIPNVVDEAVFKERDDRVVRATTTAASLDATHASGDRPRCQEAIGGAIAQTKSERASKHSYDSPLS
ncbi:putative ribonuclease H-like domain-containing protein [Tanacetum coccineum]|uniref:Ribonuclease H-like domain-containing protein n=1 Tax=Tanacetum coccineum TaxID=301880 RepID=A0ABQ5GMS6_9ASTR